MPSLVNSIGLSAASPLSTEFGGTDNDFSTLNGIVFSQSGGIMYALSSDPGAIYVGTDYDGNTDVIVPGATGTVLTSTGTTGIPSYQALPTSIVTYSNVTSSTVTMSANHGYIINYASACTLTLPATAAIGDVFYIYGSDVSNIWKIAQNSGQSICFGNVTTTVGTGGYIQATLARDCISLICITANTQFLVTSVIGNPSYV